MVTPDLLQFKPGEFELDGCGACGHVFQNPRLSLEGLDFYYRDFYDGMGGEQLEFVFSSDDTSYRGRADMVAAHARRRSAGSTSAAATATSASSPPGCCPTPPSTASTCRDGIVEAERRRWIDRGYVGLFPDLAADLQGAYDVVSMHHYLEHTRDPAAELDAAATVLESGGHLLIEVPDPECRSARLLGWLWGPWFQPQHQHFVSVANLTVDARRPGLHGRRRRAGPGPPAGRPRLRPDAAHQPHRRPPGQAVDRPDLEPGPAPARRLLHGPAPVMVGALFFDRAIAPARSAAAASSNTYRLLARRA